jgi:hypothetical protein
VAAGLAALLLFAMKRIAQGTITAAPVQPGCTGWLTLTNKELYTSFLPVRDQALLCLYK